MKINQKIELENGKKIPLMESFLSIQGEGFFSGKSSYFLRIGGCDVGCHWCDVKESWDPSIHPLTKVDDIIDKIKQYSVKIVVVTGGEPLMYNLDYLCQSLKLLDIKIHLETSGAYKLSGNFDWICLSPKKTLKPLKNIYNISDELKIIVSNKNDLKWAQDQKNWLVMNVNYIYSQNGVKKKLFYHKLLILFQKIVNGVFLFNRINI